MGGGGGGMFVKQNLKTCRWDVTTQYEFKTREQKTTMLGKDKRLLDTVIIFLIPFFVSFCWETLSVISWEQSVVGINICESIMKHTDKRL